MVETVTLITGAAQGIGLAIAERLGGRLALLDRDRDGVEAAAAGLRDNGCEVLAITADLADPHLVASAVSTAAEHFGRLDVLVNNAGVDTHLPLEEWTAETFDRVLQVDLRAVLLAIQTAAPYLAESGIASVVNIASIMANYTAPGYAAYTAAKAGVIGLSKALAVELGPRGIRVNAVCPGFIDTAKWDSVLQERSDPDYARSVAEAHPLRRRGLPSDVAAVVAFLASADSSFVTGTSIVVDGGLTACLRSPT